MMSKTNIRFLIDKADASSLLYKAFSYVIKNHLQLNAEDDGFLLSSRWMLLFVYEKDPRLASLLSAYQYLESKWCTELDFCDSSDIKDIDAYFEERLTEILMNLIEYSEENYGDIVIIDQ